jgi:hypothetical protein
MSAKPSKINISEVVQKAVELHNEVKAKQQALEELKATIRNYAAKDSPESEKMVYKTDAGSAEVVFVSPRLKIKKGANPHHLVAASILDESTYEHLFREEIKIVLCDDFDAAVKLLPKEQQKEVNALIEIEVPKPRVTLK